MKRIHPLFLLLVIATLAGGGCYTLLRHPETYDLDGDHATSKACADCHEDTDLYHYTEAYGGDWYSYYPDPWAYYYQSPWWYEDYWYYSPDPDGPASPSNSGGRHLWDRGGGDPGFVPSQGGRQIESPPPTKPDRSKESDDKKAEKEKKRKKKRRLWGR